MHRKPPVIQACILSLLTLCAVSAASIAHDQRPPNGKKQGNPSAPATSPKNQIPDSTPFNDNERAIGLNLRDPEIIEAAKMLEDGKADEAIALLKERLADKSKNKADGSADDIRLGQAMIFIRAGKVGQARTTLGIESGYKKPGQTCQARLIRRIADAQKTSTPLRSKDEWFGAIKQTRDDAWSDMGKTYEKAMGEIARPSFSEVCDFARQTAKRVDEVLAARVPDDQHSNGQFCNKFLDEIGTYISQIQSKQSNIRRDIQAEMAKPPRLRDNPRIKMLEDQISDGDKVINDLRAIENDAVNRYH